jgi:multidrug efflux pump subunit AcrB
MKKVEKHQTGSYLERLQFDPASLKTWIAGYIQNIRLVLLSILTIVLIGLVSYVNLPKRLNPEVKIPIVTVATFLPGASPQDVESLVTTPLEDAIQAVEGIDQVSSISQQNVSFITVQFFSNIDREKAAQDVEESIQGIGLPANAVEPDVNALDFENVPIWQFALTSTGGVPDLMAAAEDLKDQIEDLPQVDRVETTGIETQEVVVYIDPQKLAQYQINPLQLSQLLKSARSSFPAGTIQSESNIFTLTIDRSVESIEDIRNLQLTSNGQVINLSEIASVREQSAINQQTTFVAAHDKESQRAVVFSVYKTTASDITGTGEKVKVILDEFLGSHQGKVGVISLLNTSEEIEHQFRDLLDEFATTIVLVMAVLFLFLGFRQALISSLTVPLTFLSSFFLMQLTGMTINFLSLFAFLLALGLLVDDTIVVVSAMTTYYKSGRFTPLETGILVWRDTIVPIWSTTLTTIWAFVPLLLASGIIGEFIKPIPIVVTVTMISSTAIAVLITLPLMIVLLKPAVPQRVVTLLKLLLFLAALGVIVFLGFNTPLLLPIILIYFAFSYILVRVFPALKTKTQELWSSSQDWYKRRAPAAVQNTVNYLAKSKDTGLVSIEPLAEKYERLVYRILNKKSSRRAVIIAVVIYAIFSFALLPLGFVKNEFFPKTNEDQVYVEVVLPTGSTLDQSASAAQEMLAKLRHIPEAEYVTAEVGRRAPNDSGSSALSNSANSAYFTVKLAEEHDRERSSTDIAAALREEFKNYPTGDVSVIEVSGGPPAGADVQVTLLGDDLRALEGYANQVKSYLQSQPGITNVNTSVSESTSGIEFRPDYTKMAEQGVSVETVAGSLRMYASGIPLDEIAFEEGETDKTNIIFKVTPETGSPEGLTQLQIFTNTGKAISLSALGEVRTKPNPSVITHRNYKRSISISGAVVAGGSITDENKKLLEHIESIKLKPGYAWETGGVNEENAKSIQSILQAMLLSAILILITMVVQFSSFRQAVIVLIVIPLAVSSVFLSFALLGTPLSFPALIGVLSLFGIIVTNSMFIVDKINLNQKEGMGFKEAIAEAGASRLEPIILTKLCTIFGLLPVTISDPLWRGLGGAIISGILVASTIMLLFIPVLYYEWMKDDNEVTIS